MTPADYVIDLFGGVRPLSRKLGISASAVSRWRHKMGGRIPTRSQANILKLAKRTKTKIVERKLVSK